MSYWRDRLLPASFRGVEFHVEESAQSGGRRAFMHEYPKRDDPYSEDLGRKGRGFTVTGYLVGSDFPLQRDDLLAALEFEGPGVLVLPTSGEQIVQPGPYSSIERRERGGFVEIAMNFTEAGSSAPFTIEDMTQARVESSASAAETAVTGSTTQQLSAAGPGQGWI